MLSAAQSQYWQHHYLFGKYIQEVVPPLGKSSVDNIIINTVVPVVVAYAKANDEQILLGRALEILQRIPGETNEITKKWNSLGIRSKTAFDSQALLELHNNFCLRRRCLDCTIGSALVRPVS
jgi:hypothetical protein